MVRSLGSRLHISSALCLGFDLSNIKEELVILKAQNPHIICGTPQKLHGLFATPQGISGAGVQLLVIDEADQLLARNLRGYVLDIVGLLPSPCPTHTAHSSNRSLTMGPLESLDLNVESVLLRQIRLDNDQMCEYVDQI
ncbi:hypothetical protein EIP86_002448 [Pleurotus ostreatoroseus]|nr:hypothetical protein EIP86_002448 [Pleurotus ostreatoroseus]